MRIQINNGNNSKLNIKEISKNLSPKRLENNLKGAIKWGRVKRVEKWIQEGADIASVNLSKKNENSLHIATKNNTNSEIILKLITEIETNPKYKGTEKEIINAKNINGKTPIQLAISPYRQQISIDLLKNPLVEFKLEYLGEAIQSESLELVSYILRNFKKDLVVRNKKEIWSDWVHTISNMHPLPSTRYSVYKYPIPTINAITSGLINISNKDEIKHAMGKLLSSEENPYTKDARSIVWSTLSKI